MKSFTKRIFSAAVAMAMLITTIAFPTLVKAAEVESFYADLYGVDVVFSEEITDAAEHSIAVLDVDGEVVEGTTMLMAPDKSLATNVISYNFTTPITMDEKYTLRVDGEELTYFVVEELMSENFNDLDASTGDATNPIIENWTVARNNNSVVSGVAIITEDTNLGARENDKKLVFAGDRAAITTDALGTRNSTLYADMTLYTYTGAEGKVFMAGRTSGTTGNNLYSSQSAQLSTAWIKVGQNKQGSTYYGSSYAADHYRDYFFKQDNPDAYFNLARYTATAGKVTEQPVADATNNAVTYTVDGTVTANTVRSAMRVYDDDTTDTYAGYYGAFVGVNLDTNPAIVYTGTEQDRSTELTGERMGIFTIGGTSPLVVIDNLLVTTCRAISNAKAQSFYADLYGVDVVFDKEITNAADFDIAVLGADGEVVEGTTMLMAPGETLATNVISYNFKTPITMGKKYTLSVNDFEKVFIVEELISENFDEEESNTSAVPTIDGWTVAKGTGAAYVTEDTNLGANENDKKLVLYGGNAAITTTSLGTKNSTIYADITQYFKDQANGNNKSNYLFMHGRGTSGNPGNKRFYSQQLIFESNNVKAVQYNEGKSYYTGYGVGKVDYYLANPPEGANYTANTDPRRAFFGANNEVATGKVTGVSADNTNNTVAYTVDSTVPATTVRTAMRVYDSNTEGTYGYYGGYAGFKGGNVINYTGTALDKSTELAGTEMAISTTNETAIEVIDNILVTTCREVSDAKAQSFYADLYGVDVVFDKEISSAADFDVAITDADGKNVEYTTKIMAPGQTLATNVISYNFTAPITLGKKYTLSVDGVETDFVVEELISENFDDATTSTSVGTAPTVEDFIVQKGSGVALITEDTSLGADKDDKKLVLYGDKAAIGTASLATKNSTIYADITQYFINQDTASGKYNYLGVFGRGDSSTLGNNYFNSQYINFEANYVKAVQFKRGAAVEGDSSYYASWGPGKVDYYLANPPADANYEARTSPMNAFLGEGNPSMRGKVTDVALDSAAETLEDQFKYTVASDVAATPVRAAFRVYDNDTTDTYAGYYGGFVGFKDGNVINYTGTALDKSTGLTDNRMGVFLAGTTAIDVIDNVLITTCHVLSSNVDVSALGESMECLGAEVQKNNGVNSTYAVSFELNAPSDSFGENDASTISMVSYSDGSVYTTPAFGEDSIVRWNRKDNMPNAGGTVKFAIQLDNVPRSFVYINENGDIIPTFSLYFAR